MHEQAADLAPTRVTLSLVSHTNVGKTTLARTLLRRDVGEVLDQAHVTEVAEPYVLLETANVELRLWDTPGFGDSARLLARLRREEQPVVWFVQQMWDRWTDRPLWCSQQAALNIRQQADVVLYLVNAAEQPEDAGYVLPELSLLQWLGKSVVVVLNQTGAAASGSGHVEFQIDAWRQHLKRFSVVRDVLALDAFSRCWVQEGELFKRLIPLVPESHRGAMEQLSRAWTDRNLKVFAHSISAMASYLARAGGDREGLPSRRSTKAEKGRAYDELGQRLERTTRQLTRTLLAAHDLEGEVADEVERRVDAFIVDGEENLSPEQGALLGGVVSGAVSGLAADILAGGMTVGGGMLAGAILGALGGAGLARGYQLVTAGAGPAVSWSPAFLDQLVERTLLRYLAMAHFGRGQGEFRAQEEHVALWLQVVRSALNQDREGWEEAWQSLARQAEARPLGVRQGDLSPSSETVRLWLDPAARAILLELYPSAGQSLKQDSRYR